VTQEVRKRWKRPAAIIGGILSAYHIEEASEDHVHQTHVHPDKDSAFFEGEIEVDVNVRKDGPLISVHYHDAGSGAEEEHFHGIDLSLLPDYLRPRPVPGRISPLWTLGFQGGFYGEELCIFIPSYICRR
jgi:hypothetical protein